MDDKRQSGGLAGISRLKKCYAKDPLSSYGCIFIESRGPVQNTRMHVSWQSEKMQSSDWSAVNHRLCCRCSHGLHREQL